jgi:hypothetical protein
MEHDEPSTATLTSTCACGQKLRANMPLRRSQPCSEFIRPHRQPLPPLQAIDIELYYTREYTPDFGSGGDGLFPGRALLRIMCTIVRAKGYGYRSPGIERWQQASPGRAMDDFGLLIFCLPFKLGFSYWFHTERVFVHTQMAFTTAHSL